MPRAIELQGMTVLPPSSAALVREVAVGMDGEDAGMGSLWLEEAIAALGSDPERLARLAALAFHRANSRVVGGFGRHFAATRQPVAVTAR